MALSQHTFFDDKPKYWGVVTCSIELSGEYRGTGNNTQEEQIGKPGYQSCDVLVVYERIVIHHLLGRLCLAFPLILAVLHEQSNILHDSARNA